MLAAQQGADVTPVWNKSNREHLIIGSEPTGTRADADAAVEALGWTKPYFLYADHINLKTFERFVAPCDFFTIDVADNIGQKSDDAEIAKFVERHPELTKPIRATRESRSFWGKFWQRCERCNDASF